MIRNTNHEIYFYVIFSSHSFFTLPQVETFTGLSVLLSAVQARYQVSRTAHLLLLLTVRLIDTDSSQLVTCFFAGNLGRVDLISEYEYDLFIRPDTCNPRFRLWFNFIVDNIRNDQVSRCKLRYYTLVKYSDIQMYHVQ